MKATEQTLLKLERLLRKTAQHLPTATDDALLTDLHIQVRQESGELRVYDDNDTELTRCVVEQWIDNREESFYEDVARELRNVIASERQLIDSLNLLRPYSFVLIDEERETIAELYLVDDDLIVIDHELMPGLSDELDHFWQELERG